MSHILKLDLFFYLEQSFYISHKNSNIYDSS